MTKRIHFHSGVPVAPRNRSLSWLDSRSNGIQEMVKTAVTVAKYLEQQIAVCGKSQREISTEIGYANPNIMTMFKTGATKIPLTKVGPLAKALSVDPAFMLRLVINEYMPETWEAIEGILGKDNLMTDQDMSVAAVAREAAGGAPFDLSIAENRKTLGDAIKDIVARDEAKATASAKRMSSLPPNSRHRKDGFARS